MAESIKNVSARLFSTIPNCKRVRWSSPRWTSLRTSLSPYLALPRRAYSGGPECFSILHLYASYRTLGKNGSGVMKLCHHNSQGYEGLDQSAAEAKSSWGWDGGGCQEECDVGVCNNCISFLWLQWDWPDPSSMSQSLLQSLRLGTTS